MYLIMEINWLFLILLGVVIELVTVITRFGLRLRSKDFKKKIHFPVKFHHLYLGIALFILGIFYQEGFINFLGPIGLLEIGGGIALSDLLHHFIVMKGLTGKTEFP